MWNQFFLLEEYTGTDYQYVGKVSLFRMHLCFDFRSTGKQEVASREEQCLLQLLVRVPVRPASAEKGFSGKVSVLQLQIVINKSSFY